MGFLSGLLPGIRDLRAPLVTGYAWILVAFVGISLADNGKVLRSITAHLESLNEGLSVFLAGAVSVLAYLLGIASMRVITPIAYLFSRMLVFLVSAPGLLVVDALGGAESAFERYMRRWHSLVGVDGAILESPDVKRAYEWEVDTLSDAYILDQEFSRHFLAELGQPLGVEAFLRRCAEDDLPPAVFLGSEHLTARKALALIRKPPDTATSDSIREQVLRRVGGLATSSAQYRRALIKAFYSPHEHAEDLNREIQLVPARLISQNPAVYDRWDRLVAESEFRKGISMPILFVGIAGWVQYASGWPIFAGVCLLAAVLMVDGEDKRSSAHVQLIEVARAGIVSLARPSVVSGEIRWSSPAARPAAERGHAPQAERSEAA